MKRVNIFKCNSCDYYSISKKYICPKCRKGKFEEVKAESKGTVYSFTDIHMGPADFASLTPYTIALVQLDGVNVKITVRMKEPVQIGDPVDLHEIENKTFLYKKT